ncbi:MAG: flagellar protein FlbD [Microbacteriaceae bacterium]|nr:flagellar protein FlbD [Microbacteriaceae bacterium]
MIIVTKLNDTRFAVNPDLIERISTEPDTTITMVGGVKYVVLEPLGDVIDLVAQFRARVLAEAYERRGISSIEADGN